MRAAFALVLNAVDGTDRGVDALARDLDFELLAGFDAVGKAAQFGHEFVVGVDFLDVAFGFHEGDG